MNYNKRFTREYKMTDQNDTEGSVSVVFNYWHRDADWGSPIGEGSPEETQIDVIRITSESSDPCFEITEQEVLDYLYENFEP